MRKLYSLLVCAFLQVTGTQAQGTGTLMLGANVLSCGSRSMEDRAIKEQSLQVKFGYFAAPRLAIGLCLEAGINGNKSVPYGLTLFSRWYAGDTKAQQTFKFYVEAGAGIADHREFNKETGMLPPDKNWMKATAYISPGIDIFPTRWLALELAPEYRHIGGDKALNRFGMSAGVKIFLSEQLFKSIFPNEFRSLY